MYKITPSPPPRKPRHDICQKSSSPEFGHHPDRIHVEVSGDQPASKIKDSSGEIIEVRCTYDPETRGGNAPDGRKVKGTIHWVSARHSAQAEVRLYEPLFVDPEPHVSSEDDLKNALNETSLTTLDNVQVEPSLAAAPPGSIFQFERLGYFCVDRDSTDARRVFNRTVALRDSWAKARAK